MIVVSFLFIFVIIIFFIFLIKILLDSYLLFVTEICVLFVSLTIILIDSYISFVKRKIKKSKKQDKKLENLIKIPFNSPYRNFVIIIFLLIFLLSYLSMSFVKKKVNNYRLERAIQYLNNNKSITKNIKRYIEYADTKNKYWDVYSIYYFYDFINEIKEEKSLNRIDKINKQMFDKMLNPYKDFETNLKGINEQILKFFFDKLDRIYIEESYESVKVFVFYILFLFSSTIFLLISKINDTSIS